MADSFAQGFSRTAPVMGTKRNRDDVVHLDAVSVSRMDLERCPSPVSPTGITSRPPTRSCSSSAGGTCGAAGDDDRVERRACRASRVAIAAADVDLHEAEPCEVARARFASASTISIV